MNMSKKLLVGAISLLAMGATQAATIHIDDFADAQSLVTASSTSSNVALNSPNALASSRDVALTASGANVNFTTQVCSDGAQPANGVSCGAFSADSGITGTMTITWNFSTAADLTDGGANDALLMNLNFTDFSSNLDITAVSGATNSTHATAATPFLVSGFPGQNMTFNFADFSDSGVFSSVDTLIFAFTYTSPATDMEINFLDSVDNDPPASVPNPAPLAMFGLGLIGAWVARKRKI